MTGDALLVGDLLFVETQMRHMARRTLLCQHRVRWGKVSRGVHAPIAAHCVPREPSDSERGSRNGKPETPAAHRGRSFEVVQIDSLGELFGCACAWHGRFALKSQRHHSVYGAEQN